MTLKEIGIIHSPYKIKEDAPRQGRLKDNTFKIEVYPEYAPGLKCLDSISHLMVLYWADKSDRTTLQVDREEELRGVFATRSPSRPNPINHCVAKILKIEDNILTVDGLDALDQSPLIDLKPYAPAIDIVEDAWGWAVEETQRLAQDKE